MKPISPDQEDGTGKVSSAACSDCGDKMLRELSTSEPLSSSCEICQLGLLLITLQVADALLTITGLRQYGLRAEGNGFIREMMGQFGAMEVLTLLKITAVLAIVVLVKRIQHNSKVARGLFIVTCFYVVVALLPWVYFLYVVPLSTG